MTRRLIIECGVAETRAALLVDDMVWRFWFGPARGDEARDNYPQAGRRFFGQITHVDKAIGAAFVDIGDTRHGFLDLKRIDPRACVEGATIKVEIKSPPRQEKGAVLSFLEAEHSDKTPGRAQPVIDAAVEAAHGLGRRFDEILIDDGLAMRVLESAGLKNVVADGSMSLFEKFGANEALDSALRRSVSLAGGGAIAIDEVQALTAIDVDTGGMTAASSARLRERIACAALSESVRQISLRDIGGHIVIDIPTLKSETSRKNFLSHAQAELGALEKVSAVGFSRSGLFCFTVAQRCASLSERFTAEVPTTINAGREFSVDFLTKRMISELEGRLRSNPSARFDVECGEKLSSHASSHYHWAERVSARFGARFDFRPQSNKCGQAYAIVEQ